MNLARRRTSPSSIIKKRVYWQRVKSLFGSSLVGYWPLWETSGTVANDVSGNSRNGVYATTTLNDTISPLNKSAPLFNTSGTVAINPTSALNGIFNGGEGMIAGFSKVLSAGVWTDATTREIIHLYADANNMIKIRRSVTNNQINFFYRAGSTLVQLNWPYINTSTWFHWSLSWSKSHDRITCRVNGVIVGTVTGLGTWVGNLDPTFARIGGFSTSAEKFSGWESDIILINREPTNAEAIHIASGLTKIRRVSVLGDSISLIDVTNYSYLVSLSHNAGWTGLLSHAVGGQSIMTHMDAQVAATSSDDADIIIIALGTNDNDAGDMVALQTKVETNIIALKASNPRARLYYSNVLPRWTDTGGSTIVDKSHIRTAIAAACTAQSITCWDTFTTPWITAAQTIDGLHPNTVGQAAMAAQILSRLP